jgi:hypothetical protein
MEFLYDQLSKKAIPHIRPGMLEDLIAFVEGARQDLAIEVMAQRMAQQAQQAQLEEVAKVAKNEQKDS